MTTDTRSFHRKVLLLFQASQPHAAPDYVPTRWTWKWNWNAEFYHKYGVGRRSTCSEPVPPPSRDARTDTGWRTYERFEPRLTHRSDLPAAPEHRTARGGWPWK